MELHSSFHDIFGVILPDTTHSFLIAYDRSVDTKISLLAAMMTMTTGTALPEPRREETGRTLGVIHVLLLVPDETHSRVDSIHPRGLVHLISRYFDDPTAKNLAVLFRMNSGSLETMIRLALTQSNIPPRKIQSMCYPTSAR